MINATEVVTITTTVFQSYMVIGCYNLNADSHMTSAVT